MDTNVQAEEQGQDVTALVMDIIELVGHITDVHIQVQQKYMLTAVKDIQNVGTYQNGRTHIRVLLKDKHS